MSRICANCGKGAQVGHGIPNSKLHTKRRFQVNLQKFRIKVNGKRSVLLCSSCWSIMHKRETKLAKKGQPESRE